MLGACAVEDAAGNHRVLVDDSFVIGEKTTSTITCMLQFQCIGISETQTAIDRQLRFLVFCGYYLGRASDDSQKYTCKYIIILDQIVFLVGLDG